MSVQDKVFTPGKILHDSIVGALRCRGKNLSKWCKENGLLESTAKAATYGQMSGPKGLVIRDALIEAAGYDAVLLSYKYRIDQENQQLNRLSNADADARIAA